MDFPSAGSYDDCAQFVIDQFAQVLSKSGKVEREVFSKWSARECDHAAETRSQLRLGKWHMRWEGRSSSGSESPDGEGAASAGSEHPEGDKKKQKRRGLSPRAFGFETGFWFSNGLRCVRRNHD